jgi:hypothetical protein
VAVSDLIAEFELRLAKTGRDGITLIHESRILGVYEYHHLSPPARDAVNYIAGKKRKKLTYSQWLADRKYRKTIYLSQENPIHART